MATIIFPQLTIMFCEDPCEFKYNIVTDEDVDDFEPSELFINIAQNMGYSEIDTKKFNVAIAKDHKGIKCAIAIKPYNQAIAPYLKIKHPNVLELIKYEKITITDSLFLKTYKERYRSLDTWFVVTKYVDGENFEDAIVENINLTPNEMLNIATQLFDGVNAIHATGYLHLDLLWMANIIVTPENHLVIIDVEGGNIKDFNNPQIKDPIIKDRKEAAALLINAIRYKMETRRNFDNKYYQLRDKEESTLIYSDKYPIIAKEFLSYYPSYHETTKLIISAFN